MKKTQPAARAVSISMTSFDKFVRSYCGPRVPGGLSSRLAKAKSNINLQSTQDGLLVSPKPEEPTSLLIGEEIRPLSPALPFRQEPTVSDEVIVISDSEEVLPKLIIKRIRQNETTNDGASTSYTSKLVKVTKRDVKLDSDWRFQLPREYNAHDTRWTLKNRRYTQGLVELMPRTKVYVRQRDLMSFLKESKDCETLALRLILEVFREEALGVCLSPIEHINKGNKGRPALDKIASTVLIDYVTEYGTRRGWTFRTAAIVNRIHSAILEIREKKAVYTKKSVRNGTFRGGILRRGKPDVDESE